MTKLMTHITKARIGVVTIAGTLALAALGSATAAERAVTITPTGFVPQALSVAAGDSVTWRNADTRVHQVVFDKTPCNLTIQPAASGSCTFRTGGKFNYRDPSAPGGKFRGTITVTGARTSVTLSSSPRVVTFGAPATLSGVISSQQTGEKVTVSAQECGKTAFARLADATTTAGGNWTLAAKPTMNTVYRARWRTTDSSTVNVNVRPQPRRKALHRPGRRRPGLHREARLSPAVSRGRPALGHPEARRSWRRDDADCRNRRHLGEVPEPRAARLAASRSAAAGAGRNVLRRRAEQHAPRSLTDGHRSEGPLSRALRRPLLQAETGPVEAP